MKLHRLSLLGVVVVAAAVSGCGGGNGAESTQSEAASTSSSSAGSTPTAKTVTIKETEYKLSPSSVTLAAPGKYTFKVVNNGSISHALEIEGSGVEEKTDEIAPGSSATLAVDLKGAGTYEMYCPVDGHRQQGMDGKVTIGSSAASGAGTTMQTSTTPTTTSRYGY
jgi:plastocyanin